MAEGWLAVTAAAVCLACAPRPRVADGPRAPAATEVRIVAGGRRCDTTRDDRLAALVAREAGDLRDSFLRAGATAGTPLVDPTRAQLLADLGRPSSAPLVWVFSGHARWIDAVTGVLLTEEEHRHPPTRPVKSAVCLASGPLAIDEVVKALPRGAPFAFLIVNACFSAHVDVRHAPIDVAVLSASPYSVDVPGADRTVIGAALHDALERRIGRPGADWLSDLDVFSAINGSSTGPQIGAPIPKLRRQLRSTPALFRPRSSGIAAPPAGADGPPAGGFTWRWDADENLLSVVGYLPAAATFAVGDGVLGGTGLTAVPCHDDVAQCFTPMPKTTALHSGGSR